MATPYHRGLIIYACVNTLMHMLTTSKLNVISLFWCPNILGATAEVCLGQHTHNSIHSETFVLQMYLYLINLTFGKCVMQFRMNRNKKSRGLLHSVRKMLFYYAY